MNYITIDTGTKGAVCVVENDKVIHLGKMDCTDPSLFHDKLTKHREKLADCIIYIEKPPYFMGTMIPSSRIAVLFECYGHVHGFVTAKGWACKIITPKQWQEPFREAIGYKRGEMSHSQWKSTLGKYAKVNYPTKGLTNDTTDALLFAMWVRFNQPTQ